jgi:site-specific recombinase XerD
MASWQANTGASLSIIGKSLNHKNVNTTAVYARLAIDPVREAMEKAAGAMFEAGGIKKDNVINMEVLK